MQAGKRRSTRARRPEDACAGFALGAASLAVSLVATLRHPDTMLGAAFLFHDEGHNLLVADVLRSGGILYRDVFYPYGPLSAYPHAMFAAAFGNTPFVYDLFLALVSAINVALAYWLVRRAASVRVAVAIAAVGFITVLPVPGSLVGGLTISSYLPLERTVLLIIALAWRPPQARSMSRSLAIGLTLGVWQGVRFGGAIFGGLSLVAIDTLCLVRARRRSSWAGWLRSLAAIAIGFTAIELAWIASAFATLQPAAARDAVWPAYMLATYDAWVTPELRWVTWVNWRLWIGQYLLPLSAAGIGILGMSSWLRAAVSADDDRADNASAAVFIPLCFYVVGSFFYFRHVHHFRQFMWTLVPASAWYLERATLPVRATVAALWAPGWLTMMRSVFITRAAASTIALALPAGGTVHLRAMDLARVQFLDPFTPAHTDRPVVFVTCASGWYYGFHVPRPTRHTWLIGPSVVRPYDERAFTDALERAEAVVDCEEREQSEDGVLARLPAGVAAVARSRLKRSASGGGCSAFRIRE